MTAKSGKTKASGSSHSVMVFWILVMVWLKLCECQTRRPAIGSHAATTPSHELVDDEYYQDGEEDDENLSDNADDIELQKRQSFQPRPQPQQQHLFNSLLPPNGNVQTNPLRLPNSMVMMPPQQPGLAGIHSNKWVQPIANGVPVNPNLPAGQRYIFMPINPTTSAGRSSQSHTDRPTTATSAQPAQPQVQPQLQPRAVPNVGNPMAQPIPLGAMPGTPLVHNMGQTQPGQRLIIIPNGAGQHQQFIAPGKLPMYPQPSVTLQQPLRPQVSQVGVQGPSMQTNIIQPQRPPSNIGQQIIGGQQPIQLIRPQPPAPVQPPPQQTQEPEQVTMSNSEEASEQLTDTVPLTPNTVPSTNTVRPKSTTRASYPVYQATQISHAPTVSPMSQVPMKTVSGPQETLGKPIGVHTPHGKLLLEPYSENYCDLRQYSDEHLAAKNLQRVEYFVANLTCSRYFFECAVGQTFLLNCTSKDQVFDINTVNCNFKYNVKPCSEYDHVLHCTIHEQCEPEQFSCCAPPQQCIPWAKRCDGVADCADGDDENNCPSCDADEFPCVKNGKCIPLEKRCNGIPDECFDQTNLDETNCAGCPSDKFACSRSSDSISQTPICIDLNLRCNGIRECPRGEDELNCKSKGQKYLLCENQKQSVAKEQWCDGYEDCLDGTDEKYCIY